jgi:hypothetical protein
MASSASGPSSVRVGRIRLGQRWLITCGLLCGVLTGDIPVLPTDIEARLRGLRLEAAYETG